MEDCIPQKFWSRYWTDQVDHWIAEKHPSSFEINHLLRIEVNKIWSFITKQKAHHNRSVSLDDIREAYYKKSKYELSFNEYLQQYIRKNPEQRRYRTIQVYKSFQNHINEFKPYLPWSELTPILIDNFNRYLQNDKNLKGAARKKYFDKFKVIYRDGCKHLQMDFNHLLFDDLKIKVEKPKRVSLSDREMEQWVVAAVPDDMALYRDQFTFQLYSGLYYSDVVGLEKSVCIKSTSEGWKYIEGFRGKNEEGFVIPLLAPVLDIIDKYSVDGCETFFPKYISEQKYNQKLKQIAVMLKWSFNISNKVARHSFTDLMIGSKGIPRAIVSKMLGHTKEETTSQYYDVNPDHIFKQYKSANPS